MLKIRCPNCKGKRYLVLPIWEDSLIQIDPGKPVRIGLFCKKCQSTFLLQATLSQVIEEDKNVMSNENV